VKRVLVIAYYYPPLADVGARRTVRYVTHMRKFGWDPHVLTVKNPDSHYCVMGVEEVPVGIPVTRAISIVNTSLLLGKLNGGINRLKKVLPFFRMKHAVHEWLQIPDPLPGWLIPAYVAGKRLLGQNKFDLIYASVKPLGCGLLARRLAAEYRIPFVTDARDPLSCRVLDSRAPETLKELSESICERILIHGCKKFIVTTETTRQSYIRNYPESRHKFHLIYNGFDPVENTFEVKFCRDKLNIIYLGNFYVEDHDPTAFFRAWKELIEENAEVGRNIIFRHLGGDNSKLRDIADSYGLRENVELHGMKSREEMMAYVKASDLFYVRTQFKTNVSAKLFDGLAVNIPILATFAHSEVEQLIRHYSIKHTILPDENVNDIKKAILRHFVENQYPGLRPYNRVFLNDFNGEILTKKCTDILNGVVNYGL
jgi:glycosyltransferase involved in cell wall biosynthesis